MLEQQLLLELGINVYEGWLDQLLHTQVLQNMLEKIATSPSTEIAPHFDVLYAVLSIPDMHQSDRLVYAFEVSNRCFS